jgi:hypothetical protein
MASAAVSSQGLFDLDVQTVSDDGSFIVLYSDVSNNGHMTATLGEVSTACTSTQLPLAHTRLMHNISRLMPIAQRLTRPLPCLHPPRIPPAQITGAGELVRSSADFLLNAGNDDLVGLYSWGAMAAGITTSFASQTAILTSVHNGDCSAEAR